MRLSLSLLLPCLFIAPTAMAVTKTCDGCTEAEMSYMVSHILIFESGAYRNARQPAYVANPQSRSVMKGIYSWNYEADGETIVQHVSMSSVEPQIFGFVNTLADAYGERMLTSSAVGLADSNRPTSIYDVIDNPSREQQVVRAIENSKADFFQRAAEAAKIVNPFPGFNPGGVNLTIKFIFDDKSTATYTFDSQTKSWVRVKDSQRDSSGNIVPITKSDFSGGEGGTRTYDFSNSQADMDKFYAWANRSGIRFTQPTGSGTRTSITCASTKDGVICHIVAY
ncbi:hypothetical protein V2H26_16915 [Xanthomonas euvesicatoria]|uniref:hypothetical protein n=1 Tax=Xanthomonas citri TaxID=346 RepID=UPI000F80038D|nr:hypothetical protein [Xanthomonas axonopodis]MEE5091673.1 hypothetical protein [Xanthomonas euvesicatoria]RTE55815.1 hypothetical protein EI541_21815 [Xanthomonas axonopodis pv. eucalyptorum]